MFFVRFVALAALVVWLGVMLAAVPGQLLASRDQLAYLCAAIILACLLIMKFVGPVPPGFVPRAAIVVAMLATIVAPQLLDRLPFPAMALLASRIALGFVLLAWYAKE